MQTIKAGCSSNLLMINILRLSTTFTHIYDSTIRGDDSKRCRTDENINFSGQNLISVVLEKLFLGLENVFVDEKCVSVVFTFALLLYVNNRHGSGSNRSLLGIYRLNSLLWQS